MPTEGGFEQVVSLVSPAEGDWIATLSILDIIISAWAVADVVWEFVRGSKLVGGGVAIVQGFAEDEIFLLRWFELTEWVQPIFAKKTAVVLSNISIPASSIRTIIRDFSFRGDCFVCIHNKIIITSLI